MISQPLWFAAGTVFGVVIMALLSSGDDRRKR